MLIEAGLESLMSNEVCDLRVQTDDFFYAVMHGLPLWWFRRFEYDLEEVSGRMGVV